MEHAFEKVSINNDLLLNLVFTSNLSDLDNDASELQDSATE